MDIPGKKHYNKVLMIPIHVPSTGLVTLIPVADVSVSNQTVYNNSDVAPTGFTNTVDTNTGKTLKLILFDILCNIGYM